MKSVDRNGVNQTQNETQDKVLGVLYQTLMGRILLRQLVKPWVSKAGGRCLNHPMSKCLIGPFIKKNHINMDEYEECKYRSYNEFFTRQIKEGKRNIDSCQEHLIAPCDSKLSLYDIDANARFQIKNTRYSMERLVRSKKLAQQYEGGLLLVFRLTVDDYHRFCYIDEGNKTKNYHIPGVFHTVNPIANDTVSIYKENTREFSILKSKNFGNVLMMEVGALMVGKIINYHEAKQVVRGEEKGRFEFGGSTVIICLKKDSVVIDEDIYLNSKQGIETVVKLGEKIGIKKIEN